MKADILKNLPSKIREKAFINIVDENLRNEFITYMRLLREGRGVLGKLARVHHQENTSSAKSGPYVDTEENYHQPEEGVLRNREVLHHLYKISGRSKIHRITLMLRHWLADNTKGKLCIFAHHLEVLDEISGGAGLSNAKDSITKFIRIDGSTSPKSRQEQILQFQTDPKIRIAMLGITAAGVAVTLTASSTVWFAELFWTPAIMIQAEDRCHRIGQQARVRCLYFIGKGTLDEVLWKLIEKKFRALGEFVEGKENMGIALERELEDGEHDEILKTEDNDNGGDGKKRKSQDDFNELLDTDDPELKNEIDELCHEEEDMLLLIKNDDDEDEPDADENIAPSAETFTSNKAVAPDAKAASTDAVIELSDDDEEEVQVTPLTFAHMRNRYRASGMIADLRIDPKIPLTSLRLYTVNYPGPQYGLIMISYNNRVVVKSHQTDNNLLLPSRVGSIIVGVNGILFP
jgi:SWI/SNF-related matrix-associated actin-dependent regulator 1 of chromatin subfamily A